MSSNINYSHIIFHVLCILFSISAQMSIIFIDKAAKLKTLLGILNESSTVKLIVLMDGPIPDEMKMDFEKREIEIILYQDLMEIGNNNPHEPKV